MPTMADPRFHKAVILMCTHDENGAMGLVINQALPSIIFNDLVAQLPFKSDIKIDLESSSIPLIMSGGPVDQMRGFLLHSVDFHRKETLVVDQNFGVTGTVDALMDVVLGNGPDKMLFILGYAGWGAGQLDSEIKQNAWLVVDSHPDIVFHKDPQEKWIKAVNTLGIDPSMLSGIAGSA